jgi:peptide/nickel transport system substrate-binding protein
LTKMIVLESLFMQKLNGELMPVLATGMTWSNNNTTATITLRKGVKFHDGSDFNAQVAMWNLDRMKTAKAAGTDIIKTLVALDDYTLQINLTEFKSTFIDNISSTGQSNMATMISKKAYEKLGPDGIAFNPVGTGPFMFKSLVKDQSYEVVRFDGYWGDKANLDGMKWIFVPDALTAQMEFTAGNAEMIATVGHDADIGKAFLENNAKGYKVMQNPLYSWVIIPPSARSASPFSKEKVRQAVDYALDRDSVIKSIYFGYAIPVYTVPMSNQLPYDPNFKGRGYDTAKAKQLLADAGYPGGFNTTLYCQTLIYGKAIDAVQAFLKDVGINAKLEVVSTAKWIDMETNGWADGLLVTQLGAETFNGQTDRDWITPKGPNWSQGLWYQTMARPPELEALVQKLLHTMDVAEQKTTGAAIAKLLFDQALVVPLWEAKGNVVVQPYVQGDFTQIWLNQGVRGRPVGQLWLNK